LARNENANDPSLHQGVTHPPSLLYRGGVATFRSVESLADFVESLPPSPRRLIGITGSPGSGKSTIAQSLVARIGSAVALPMDGFHLPQSRLVELGRRDRMGAPDTFDAEGFVATLAALRSTARAAVSAPGFDREIEEPVPNAITIGDEVSTVVVEGNYLLLESEGWGDVRSLLDATVFVRIDRGIRQQRLIERHVRFGKSPADARAWALGPDENNAIVIEATAHLADHVIDLQADLARR